MTTLTKTAAFATVREVSIKPTATGYKYKTTVDVKVNDAAAQTQGFNNPNEAPVISFRGTAGQGSVTAYHDSAMGKAAVASKTEYQRLQGGIDRHRVIIWTGTPIDVKDVQVNLANDNSVPVQVQVKGTQPK